MEQITENYVSFEVAKLLKEKRFEEHCKSLYRENGRVETVGNYNNIDDDKYISFSRPTQALVIKWLRIKHNIHVSIFPSFAEDNLSYLPVGYYSSIYWIFADNKPKLVDLPKDYATNKHCKIFDSDAQATEAAILYCLQNLIK